MKKEVKVITILLIDDNEDDILITQRAFKKIKLMNELYVVKSGEEAFDFLYHKGKYEKEKPHTPGLILLDIAMPGMDGFEVLKKLKADPKYKKTPVIMLTTSSREEDIVRSYEDGACSFITKPPTFEDFVMVIEHFEIYWALICDIPNP